MVENKTTLSFIYSPSSPAPTSDALRPSLIGFLLMLDLKKQQERDKQIERWTEVDSESCQV